MQTSSRYFIGYSSVWSVADSATTTNRNALDGHTALARAQPSGDLLAGALLTRRDER
jgi:hypothetical protein